MNKSLFVDRINRKGERMNITDWLTEKRHSNSLAIVSDDTCITYKQLYNYSISLSKTIKNIKSRNIGLFAKTTYKYIIGYFAILYARKCIVPLKVSGKKAEKQYIINKADIQCVVTDSYLELDDIEEVFIDEFSSIEAKDNKTIIDNESDRLLLETTGTTGGKKLVRLSEKNLQFVVNSYCNIRKFKQNQNVNYMILLPLQSAYGNFVFLSCICIGATIFVKDDFMPWDFRKMVLENRITHIECVSSLLIALSKIYSQNEWGNLTYLGYGGEKVHESDIKKILKVFPRVQICQGYGLTEAGPMVSYIPPELSIWKQDMFLQKINSVGIPLKGLRIKINDPDEGGKGEILVSGPSITKGYYKENSEAIFCGEFLKTGDIGFIDSDGYIFVTGRKKNIVIVQGMNIQIEEVENVLKDFKLIEDVKVYGKRDPYLGERLCADIVSNAAIDINDIKKFMMEKVDIHKIPTEINIVDNIERVGGKIKR